MMYASQSLSFAFFSLGDRNHTACCHNNGLSASCLHFCSGKTVNMKASDFVCLAQASIMTQCFDAGVRNVPSPPTNFVAASVSFQSITWAWKMPSSRGDTKSEMNYGLSYQNLSDAGKLWVVLWMCEWTFLGVLKDLYHNTIQTWWRAFCSLMLPANVSLLHPSIPIASNHTTFRFRFQFPFC